eukprot:5967737-Prymnesium_polylepis.1
MAVGLLSWHSMAHGFDEPLYTGLKDVWVHDTASGDVENKSRNKSFLRCHMSASMRRSVGEEFRGARGVLITIPPQRLMSKQQYD